MASMVRRGRAGVFSARFRFISVCFGRGRLPIITPGAAPALFQAKSASSACAASAGSYRFKSILLSPAHSILKDVFGYERFRGPQESIVEHVAAGGDALVLMPTGGGKSLCYQDQVGALHEAGVEAAFLNSTLDWQQTLDVERRLARGATTLLYAAPERVTTERFLGLLDELHARGQLALFAIDEAHCVSQWGHDFRPEYRQLAVLHQRYAGVPRIALTATADALTRADILEGLQLQDAHQFVSSFDRPNIRYRIEEKKEPLAQLLRFIEREHAGDAGVVYCQSRKRVEEMAQALQDAGVHALPYHAGLPAEMRQAHQDRFLREDGVVMVATITTPSSRRKRSWCAWRISAGRPAW